jgi:hypothetical protein
MRLHFLLCLRGVCKGLHSRLTSKPNAAAAESFKKPRRLILAPVIRHLLKWF